MSEVTHLNRRPTGSGERGSAMIVSLLLVVLLFSLGAALLAVSETENVIAVNDQWSEGAFLAAEAAVQVVVDQMAPGNTDPVVNETVLNDDFTYRSGGRDDTSGQAPALVGSIPGPGYSVGSSTGYNPSGYVFQVFQVNGTGIGPRNAVREVEVQVEIGPVSQ